MPVSEMPALLPQLAESGAARVTPPFAAEDEATLRGPWRAAAHGLWYLVATAAVGALLLAIPAYLLRLGHFTSEERGFLTPITLRPAWAFANDLAITLLSLATAALSLVLGVLIFRRKPNNGIALLAAGIVLYFGVLGAPLETVLSLRPPWIWLAWFLDFLLLVPVTLLFYLFPDGRFRPGWTRWLAYGLLPWLLITLVYPPLQSWTVTTASAWTLLLFVWYLAWPITAVAAQIYRYRRVSSMVQRQQTRWVVLGFALAISLLLLSSLVTFALPLVLASPALLILGLMAMRLLTLLVPAVFVVTLAIAVLRYRLFEIDVVIRRALVYGALTTGIVALYVVVVGGFSLLSQSRGNLLVALLVTGLVAVIFQPVRDRLQRGVNRLLYGERDEPYTVLAQLGQRLEATLALEAVLPAVVDTVARALKLPYAAVVLGEAPDAKIAAVYGTRLAETLRLPLAYRGETVGELVVASRASGETFTPAERQLLTTLAHQAGAAAYAVRLAADLQRSRERLVTAREEERRRLRRDLHDGLGPQLASQTLTLAAVSKLLRHDPDRAEVILNDARAQNQTAIADIRRVVYELRPPALDDLGLVAALQEQAGRYQVGGLQVTVQAPAALPPLPAAVEVACYRIAQEALTNVVRHAEAHACTIRLQINQALWLEIADDGRGLAAGARGGVGLTAMRERAAELGGTCAIAPGPAGGTIVSVRLPLDTGVGNGQ